MPLPPDNATAAAAAVFGAVGACARRPPAAPPTLQSGRRAPDAEGQRPLASPHHDHGAARWPRAPARRWRTPGIVGGRRDYWKATVDAMPSQRSAVMTPDTGPVAGTEVGDS